MRRVIYLARHGETDWNRAGRWQGWTDVPLNETGEAQALSLAESLRGCEIARIVASDLSRARRTAEIVASTLSVECIGVDPDLRERAFGLFEGLTRDECAARYPEEWACYREGRGFPAGTEPHDVVTDRMRCAIRRAATGEVSATGAVLVVTHGSALRSFVLAATGTMPEPLSNCALFRATALVDEFVEIERIC
jgi:probable phosphoglycerate mutase